MTEIHRDLLLKSDIALIILENGRSLYSEHSPIVLTTPMIIIKLKEFKGCFLYPCNLPDSEDKNKQNESCLAVVV